VNGAVVMLVVAAVLVAVGLGALWAPLAAVPGVALAAGGLLLDVDRWERRR